MLSESKSPLIILEGALTKLEAKTQRLEDNIIATQAEYAYLEKERDREITRLLTENGRLRAENARLRERCSHSYFHPKKRAVGPAHAVARTI